MNLLDLVAKHLVQEGRASSVYEAVGILSEMDNIEELLLKIKYEVLPFSAGVRTFELPEVGECEFCHAAPTFLIAVLTGDPDQRVCSDCHADSRIPTTKE